MRRSSAVPLGVRDDLLVLATGLLTTLVFVVAEMRVAGVLGLPLDDSWIHLRFASNLATGRGFAINPGEPVAGSTAPLWTLALAGLIALGVPALAAAKALGVTLYLATGLLTRRLALALGLAPGIALAAGVAVVGLGRLVWGGLSAMEVPLAAALVAAAALAEVRGRSRMAAAVLGLATLARPEAGILILLHALGAGRLGPALARLGVAAAVVSPAVLFNLVTSGRVVPATAAAKVTGGVVGRTEGLPDAFAGAFTQVGAYLREWGALLLADHPALPVLLVAGLVVLRRSRLRFLLFALLLHPIAVALVAPYRGPAFQTGRYSSHVLPLAAVAAAAGLGALLARVPSRAVRTAVVAACLLGLGWKLGPASTAYAWGVQNINEMQVRLGRWVADHTPPSAILAVNDVGAVTYFGDRRILDLMGLVTPEILPYRREGSPGTLRFLEERCPDYLVIFPDWFPDLAARGDLFRELVGVFLPDNRVSGAPYLAVYETVWNRWRDHPVQCPGGADPRRPPGS